MSNNLQYQEVPVHNTVVVKVNADIDEKLAPLIELLNRDQRIRTISCCQGEPHEEGKPLTPAFICFEVPRSAAFSVSAPAEDGPDGHPYGGTVDFCFNKLSPLLHQLQEARVTVTCELMRYVARMEFMHEDIDKLFGLVRDMLHKEWPKVGAGG